MLPASCRQASGRAAILPARCRQHALVHGQATPPAQSGSARLLAFALKTSVTAGVNGPVTSLPNRITLLAGLALLSPLVVHGDWPALRGDVQHAGFVQADLKRPFRLAWAGEIAGERLGTAMEPIVAGGKLFVATHAGNLYALDAESGEPVWRFQAAGPFLHSPAVAEGLVVVASADGNLYALEASTGKLVWRWFGGFGGFSASPTVWEGTVFIGTRAGDFVAVKLKSGALTWRQSLGAPIRQTAAVADGQVFVTGEDLRVRCFGAGDGKLLWASEPLVGQTARDYYPIVVKQGARTLIVVRTNPILNMGQRIGRDRSLLCRNAGVDDSSWQKIDAWIKSESARGNPELWAREQAAIVRYLETNREARTFFVLDAKTGKETPPAPVLWVAGCQGVGAEPALTAEGRLLVFHRSAYGNWNHGVAPLVALGLLDLGDNKITPLFHQQGRQPAWNCFWGTADESQTFLVAGDTVLIIHQGTLSGFDLKKNELFPIWGQRDTYGGFRSPAWARNEWHGPGRGGVAVVGRRIYWQTGSRVLCLLSGEPAKGAEAVKPRSIAAESVPVQTAPKPASLDTSQVRQRLIAAVEEALSRKWAPLFTDPGLAGRVFSFDKSSDWFEALAWAYPNLPEALQRKAKTLLRDEWVSHPPFAKEAWYSLKEGARREWFWVPEEFCGRLGGDKQPHPFGGVSAAWLFGQRCGEDKLVLESWPKLKAAFEDFSKSGWKLDPAKGDHFANRYLASLLAMSRLAEKAGDATTAQQVKAKADETTEALVAWWNRAGERGTLKDFKDVGELDPFIGKGDGISLAMAPHRHKLALFQDLTPEVAGIVKAKAPAASAAVWRTFETLYRTWWLLGEERQVHFGENFVDSPDLALSGFKALAWLRGAPTEALTRQLDLPFCRADLYYVTKLGLCLDR